MSKHFTHWVALLVLIFCFNACKGPSVVIDENIPSLKKRSEKFLLSKMDKQYVDFEWYGAKAKIKYSDDQRSASFMATIRIRRDSMIWIALKKSNIEGARMAITPNTFTILDRQHKTYYEGALTEMKDKFNLDITFQDLQDILVGNPILYKDKTYEVVNGYTAYQLRHKEEDQQVTFVLNGKNFLLEQILGWSDKGDLEVTQSDFQKISEYSTTSTHKNQMLAFKRNIYVDSDENGTMDMTFTISKLALDEPQKMRFSIPEHYKKEEMGR